MIDAMNEAYVALDPDGIVIDWNEAATRIFGYLPEEALGRSAKETIIPARDHREFDWFVRHYTRGPGIKQRLDLRMPRLARHRDGHLFTVELSAASLRDGEQVFIHTFMHDITSQQRDRAELESHAADVEALAEATAALARSTTAAEARESICGAAMQVAGSKIAFLFEPEPEGGAIRVTAGVGADPGPETIAFDGEPSGVVRCFRDGEPLFISDLLAAPEIRHSMAHRTGTRSALLVPVRRDEATLGVIAVGWEESVPEVSARLCRVMTLVAAEAAVAIERGMLLEQLEHMARTDELTGLPNRRAWTLELDREIKRARRERTALTVAMVDLDHFKDYNDRNGHQAGDRLLKEAASAWRSALRETDVVARYGGEEFAIVLPGCGAAAARELVERLRALTPEGESCSAGLAGWDGKEGPEALLGRADEALYEAKRAGRDRIVTLT